MSIENEVFVQKNRQIAGKMVIWAIIGFLLGISFKNIALEKITMGYDDYKLEKLTSDYDLH